MKDWFFILLFSLCVSTKHERNSLNEAKVLRQLESEQYPKADILTMQTSHYYTEMHSSDSLKNDQNNLQEIISDHSQVIARNNSKFSLSAKVKLKAYQDELRIQTDTILNN